MTSVRLSLIVLRAGDLDATGRFYHELGVAFTREQHGGGGPSHLAAELAGVVLEVYPGSAESPPDRAAVGATMLGLRVPSVDAAVAAVRAAGATVLSKPHDTPWGRRAVVSDPDGRPVELTSVELPLGFATPLPSGPATAAPSSGGARGRPFP